MTSMRTSVRRLLRRLSSQEGFGLVELMIALTVLVVGILATIGVFQTSLLHLGRATKTATASAVGEQQIEDLRAVRYDAIALNATAWGTAVGDAVYNGDSACAGTCTTAGTAAGQSVTTGTGGFSPTQTVTGADGKRYRLDTYVTWQTIPGGRSVKKVTVVVRDTGATRVWSRITSSFDESTGL
jgi:Tfp pilus assembly protein PilV